MSKTTKAEAAKGDPQEDPEALRRDIADKRRELGDTVAELAAKADVKGQVHERVEEGKDAARDAAHQVQQTVATQARRPDPRVVGGLGAAVALLLLLLVLRKRRR